MAWAFADFWKRAKLLGLRSKKQSAKDPAARGAGTDGVVTVVSAASFCFCLAALASVAFDAVCVDLDVYRGFRRFLRDFRRFVHGCRRFSVDVDAFCVTFDAFCMDLDAVLWISTFFA